MTPLEAMAGAVADEIFGKAFALSEARREFCLKVARAALIALRDCALTEPMECATVDEYGYCLSRDVWRALIDAAIKEGP
jgi:hypothetical protein